MPNRSRPLEILRKEVHDIARAATPAHAHLRERLFAIIAVTAFVDAVGTAFVWLFEHNAKGTEIHSVGDALFWTTAQLLTVSSQFHNPLTTGGRITDVVLMFYAISVVATLAGSYGAFFFRRGMERDPID